MPALERWVLNRIWAMDNLLRQACEEFAFHALFTELHNFCALDLSAFYFDVRKDSLYCDRLDNVRRRAARTVLDILFDCLTAWLAPFICFSAEEAWLARHPDRVPGNSVHLRSFPDIPDTWRDEELAEKWNYLRDVRRVVTGALEKERAEKRIGSGLQAAPVVHAPAETIALFDGIDAAELFITSGVSFTTEIAPPEAFILKEIRDIAVVSELALGDKCERCYQLSEEVGSNKDYPNVCNRCADATEHFQPLNQSK